MISSRRNSEARQGRGAKNCAEIPPLHNPHSTIYNRIVTSPRDIRRIALQILFAFDSQPDRSADHAREVGLGATSDHDALNKAIVMATSAWEQRKQADDWATKFAPQWPTYRQPGVDRAIIRLAIWELTQGTTPPKVVLDEAIELAREFSTENSPGFVNGVMDAVLKEINSLKSF